MDELEQVAGTVSYHMEKIVENFKPPVQITVLVRRPGFPEQDFCLTDDDLKLAIEALNRRLRTKQ